MGLKYLVLFTLIIAFPLAQAQLGGIFGPGGLLGSLLGLLRIQGVVFCTPNGNVGVNGTSTPVFPNALVQLRCGGTVVSSGITDGSGVFSILLDPVNFLMTTLVSGCSLAVTTPLASCNATLPSVGGLVSNLQLLGTTISGLLRITNIIPTGFRFNANMN